MKLKVSNINLNNDGVIENLADLVSNSRILQLFDISWTSISISHLVKITESLINRQRSIRHINLSYNRLDFEKEFEKELSLKVMTNLYTLFEKAFVLCHVKLSGMNFGKEQILELCK